MIGAATKRITVAIRFIEPRLVHQDYSPVSTVKLKGACIGLLAGKKCLAQGVAASRMSLS
ncbi:hypothetical protein QFZ20_002987 [Flavobacterium sp. W4I14]|nr:hypothetical protein [Flavobacterium sp. W4I14]